MNPCPQCNRMPVSKTSPRCNFCGAPLREGEKDWATAQAETRAKQAEENKNAPSFKVLLTKAQRAKAIGMLGTSPVSSRISMWGEIADALMHDYAAGEAMKCTHCHCGTRANGAMQVDWGYEVEGRKEFGAENAAILVLGGGVTFQQKMFAVEFSTFHVTCAVCAKKDFSSKSAFEKAIEGLPGCFRHVRATRLAHQPVEDVRPSVPTPEEPAAIRYYLIVGGAEKGPFSVEQLAELAELGRIARDVQVRPENAENFLTLAALLKP